LRRTKKKQEKDAASTKEPGALKSPAVFVGEKIQLKKAAEAKKGNPRGFEEKKKIPGKRLNQLLKGKKKGEISLKRGLQKGSTRSSGGKRGLRKEIPKKEKKGR